MRETLFPLLKQSFISFFLNEVYSDFTPAYREQADLHTITCYMTITHSQQTAFSSSHTSYVTCTHGAHAVFLCQPPPIMPIWWLSEPDTM